MINIKKLYKFLKIIISIILKLFIFAAVYYYIYYSMFILSFFASLRREIFLPITIIFILLNFFCFILLRLLIIKINSLYIKKKIKRNSNNSYYIVISDILFFITYLISYIIVTLSSNWHDYIIYNRFSINMVGHLYVERILTTILLIRIFYFILSYFFNIKILYIFILDLIILLITIISVVSLYNLCHSKMLLFNYNNSIIVTADYSNILFYSYVDVSLSKYLTYKGCPINMLSWHHLSIPDNIKAEWYVDWLIYIKEQNLYFLDRNSYNENIDKFLYSRLEENYSKNYPKYVDRVRKFIFE